MPSRIGLMLDMSARHLERVIYYEDFIYKYQDDNPMFRNYFEKAARNPGEFMYKNIAKSL